MIAKLASRAAKPRASRTGLVPGPGVVLIEPDVELAFLHGHKVEALWGVGPATAKTLHELGVRTVGDLAAIPARDTGAPSRKGQRAVTSPRWPTGRTPAP